MARHFAQIFWGLLLVFLDFKINGFDVLPDGLGYLIAAAGCAGLISLSRAFEIARALCLALAGLWLVGFFVERDYAIAHGVVMTIVNCAMMWTLLGGFADFAASQQRPDLAERASRQRTAYAVITIASQTMGLVFHGSRDVAWLGFVLAIAGFVMMILILCLIHRFKVELATSGPAPQA